MMSTAPLPNCEKKFGRFSSKKPFFSIGKMKRGLTAPPYVLENMVGGGGGQLTSYPLIFFQRFLQSHEHFIIHVIL